MPDISNSPDGQTGPMAAVLLRRPITDLKNSLQSNIYIHIHTYIYIKLRNVRSASGVFSQFSFTEYKVNVPKKSCIRISHYNFYLSIFNPNPFQFKSPLSRTDWSTLLCQNKSILLERLCWSTFSFLSMKLLFLIKKKKKNRNQIKIKIWVSVLKL